MKFNHFPWFKGTTGVGVPRNSQATNPGTHKLFPALPTPAPYLKEPVMC